MAVMRIHKTGNFTIISNTHLRDKKLSLKAKGLLTLMLSLPDNWDYSVNGLACICKEGKVAVQNTLDELEENHYLVRTKERNQRGRFTCVYEIYEVPQEENQGSPETPEPDLSVPYDELDEDTVSAEEESKSAEMSENSPESGTEDPSPEHRDGFCATDNVPRHTLYKQKTNTKQQKPKTDTKHREIYIAILAHLNQRAGTAYKADNSETQKLIDSRLKEGFTFADFVKVIDRKTAEWQNTAFAQYLRPRTLFGDKFESYLNAPMPPEKEKKPDILDGIL